MQAIRRYRGNLIMLNLAKTAPYECNLGQEICNSFISFRLLSMTTATTAANDTIENNIVDIVPEQ